MANPAVNIRIGADSGQAEAALRRVYANTEGLSRSLLRLSGAMYVGNHVLGAVTRTLTGVPAAAYAGAVQIGQLQARFTTLLGSVDAARGRLAELQQLELESPFDLQDLAAASRHLQVTTGGLLATGDAFRMVVDAAAASETSVTAVAHAFGNLYGSLRAGKGDASMAVRQFSSLGLVSGDVRRRLLAMADANAGGRAMWQALVAEMQRYRGAAAAVDAADPADELRDRWNQTLRAAGQAALPGLTAAVQRLAQEFDALSQSGDIARWGEAAGSALAGVGRIVGGLVRLIAEHGTELRALGFTWAGIKLINGMSAAVRALTDAYRAQVAAYLAAQVSRGAAAGAAVGAGAGGAAAAAAPAAAAAAGPTAETIWLGTTAWTAAAAAKARAAESAARLAGTLGLLKAAASGLLTMGIAVGIGQIASALFDLWREADRAEDALKRLGGAGQAFGATALPGQGVIGKAKWMAQAFFEANPFVAKYSPIGRPLAKWAGSAEGGLSAAPLPPKPPGGRYGKHPPEPAATPSEEWGAVDAEKVKAAQDKIEALQEQLADAQIAADFERQDRVARERIRAMRDGLEKLSRERERAEQAAADAAERQRDELAAAEKALEDRRDRDARSPAEQRAEQRDKDADKRADRANDAREKLLRKFQAQGRRLGDEDMRFLQLRNLADAGMDIRPAEIARAARLRAKQAAGGSLTRREQQFLGDVDARERVALAKQAGRGIAGNEVDDAARDAEQQQGKDIEAAERQLEKAQQQQEDFRSERGKKKLEEKIRKLKDEIAALKGGAGPAGAEPPGVPEAGAGVPAAAGGAGAEIPAAAGLDVAAMRVLQDIATNTARTADKVGKINIGLR